MDKVAKFEENYVEFSKMKKKKLLESIDIARKIIAGETSYEGKHRITSPLTFLDEREKLERKDKGLPTPVFSSKTRHNFSGWQEKEGP